MDITEFNPWWETGSIDREVKSFKRRFLFTALKDSLYKKQIDIIIGLRRVGKTVLMHHLIDYLLTSGVNPKEIFYFSFDIEKEDLDRIIKEYEEKILRERIKNKRVYLFFDEIHKLKDWENKIKVLYDLNPRIKIVLSGSSSLNLIRQSKESLAGRAKFHYLSLLTFKEFLAFKNEKIPQKEEYEIYKRKLDILLNEFIFKGFPETLQMEEREIKEYVRELVIERIIYRDIPESFGVEDIEIIKILAEYIFENPGVILNIDALSKELGRHKKTIRNALNYLELSFLIKRVSNLKGSFLATSRKNKKGYPLHSSLSLIKDENKNLETLIRSEINAQYYWRKNNKEVNFILKKEKDIIPVEVKNKRRINKKDVKSLIKFCSLFGIEKGYLINKEEDKIMEIEGKKIIIIPVTKFLLFEL